MNWQTINNELQIEEIRQKSFQHPVLVFKHSTTCSISAASLGRMERAWDTTKARGIEPYYLDLLQFRGISNKIAQDFAVEHQSPQVLLIKNGACVYDASHFDIRFDELVNQVS
ncbi:MULTISPECIES: bacillithiol system redox-active protein YtxJ [Emticicia]|uniref:bacillithiol system redox-active protein YtxJ n=1 Tax=Emticicia TaxID=312278 RepID=UPI000C76E522|nr:MULTISPECIES: bacillithiol system redox-active protein YtxJ [Emticicia]PLK45019.1 bacillithiol system redox-active protein YtxJ [Emticicia sp. TH156]UTA66988.1 bacillithiol system redox-active protein YtxJ [Emticicia sp. 21SJ11W-3]